jgi:hypothetical protein
MYSQILGPVIALAGWTLVMLIWMLGTRLPAMRGAGIDLGKLTGTRGTDADKVLPAQVQWKAHNYNHLHEQPTLFYAVALTLAIIGQGHGLNLWLAWAYVILRIVHSLVQATFNRVSTRFALFLLSTLALVGLTASAAVALFVPAPTAVETTAAVFNR